MSKRLIKIYHKMSRGVKKFLHLGHAQSSTVSTFNDEDTSTRQQLEMQCIAVQDLIPEQVLRQPDIVHDS